MIGDWSLGFEGWAALVGLTRVDFPFPFCGLF